MKEIQYPVRYDEDNELIFDDGSYAICDLDTGCLENVPPRIRAAIIVKALNQAKLQSNDKDGARR